MASHMPNCWRCSKLTLESQLIKSNKTTVITAASVSPTFVSGVGGEEPDGAQPAASQVHYGGAVPQPLPRHSEVLPHTAHLRRR